MLICCITSSFTSCKGIYVRLSTGECMLDHSKVKDTTTNNENLTNSSVKTHTSSFSHQTIITSSNGSPTYSTISNGSTTANSTASNGITTTYSTTSNGAASANSTSTLATEAAAKEISTEKPLNGTSIYFKASSTDHKVYTKVFDALQLSACFWMKPKSSNLAVILSKLTNAMILLYTTQIKSYSLYEMQQVLMLCIPHMCSSFTYQITYV